MSIRYSWKRSFLAATAAVAFVGSLAFAQQTSVEEGKRKIKTKSNPTYPELARRMGIAGKVRIEVLVAPDGRVKNARAIGGHPVLIQPCLEAVRDWRFDPGPEETTQIIEFAFKE